MFASTKMVEFKLLTGSVLGSRWEGLKFEPVNSIVTILGGPMRYSISPGQDPTPNSGHRLLPGAVLSLDNFQDIKNLRMIPENTAIDVVITHKSG